MRLKNSSEAHSTIFEYREDMFGYEPSPEGSLLVEWYVNFADEHLFCAYGGPLFAQDEMQVAEHPALGSLREALLQSDIKPLTVENDEPTPIVILGVERRCRIATDRNAAQGRPFGLYGNNFAQASAEVIERATMPLVPPTITNLIAMEAPSYGAGMYTQNQIHYILRTACGGFSAARIESTNGRTERHSVVIHTGYWGCGAYGGNRVLMALLQLLAARWAGADRLIFHTLDGSGTEAFATALRILDQDLSPGHETFELPRLLAEIESLGFKWGVSDGN